MMATFILADNQELTRFALNRIILDDTKNIVLKVSDKAGLIESLKKHENATVILDYTLFDFTDVEQLLIVSSRFALSHWILVSEELTTSFLRRVVYDSHQFSIVFKDGSVNEIREAIKSTSHLSRYISQRALEIVISDEHDDTMPYGVLTATEIEIVKSITLGKSTKEIATERFSSIHTISTHRKNIFRKLGVNTAHEVVKYALRAGLVDTSEFYI